MNRPYCIGGQARTDNLIRQLADEFYRLKYSDMFLALSVAEVLKSFPVASHGESFIPPSASNILQCLLFLFIDLAYPVIHCCDHYFDKPYHY
jgi:hypothetical protein